MKMLLSFLPFTSLSPFQFYMRILHAVNDQTPSDDALEALQIVAVALSESSKAVIMNGAGVSTNAGIPVSTPHCHSCALIDRIEPRLIRIFEAVHLESTLSLLSSLPRPGPTQRKNYSPTRPYSNPTRVQLISSSWRIFMRKERKLL